MLTIIGVGVVVFSIFILIQKLILEDQIIPIQPKSGIGIAIIGFLILLLGQSVMYSKAGYQYFIVNPTGTKDAITAEGWKVVMPLSKITKWQKYIDIKVVTKEMQNDDKDQTADWDEIEGKMAPIGIRFIDQVTADMNVSIRFQLPQDHQQFIKLAVKFRSMSNLVQNTLIPTIAEQAVNTGYMFSAQNYISGAAQNFRQTFEEQLKGGAYAVEKKEIKDKVVNIQNEDDRKIKETQSRYEVIKILDKNGRPKRIKHEITENKIIVSQVIVDRVNLDPEYKKRLDDQKRESAQRQLEYQKIETAKIAQKRIAAEGERDKTQERVNQEKSQVATLINIETKLKQEKTVKKLAVIKLQTARLEAQAKKVKADAESYQNRKLVSAGLTPQERAQIDKDTAIGVAAELAKLKLPEVVITGQNGKTSGDGLISQLIGAELAKSMIPKK